MSRNENEQTSQNELWDGRAGGRKEGKTPPLPTLCD